MRTITLSQLSSMKSDISKFGRFVLEGNPFTGRVCSDDMKIMRYYYNGQLHRSDGPALISTTEFENSKQWFKNGSRYTGEVEQFCENNGIDYNSMDDLDISLITLTLYGN